MLPGVVPFPPEYAQRYRERGYWIDKTLAQEYAEVFARYADRVALIDGDHSEEAAYGDIMAVWPNVSVGGYMFIDDVNWDSVAKAVDRWAGTIAGGTAIYAAISGKLGVMRKLA